MIRGMLSLMSGLGQGYNEGAQQKLENDRRAKLDQVTLDKAAREGTEFTQAQADRTSLRTAGAPVSAVPDMGTDPQGNPVQNQAPVPGADNPDAGPWDAPVKQGAQRVGMQGMLSPDQASAAVAQQNSPDGVLARQQAEVQRQNPAAGLQMQAHGLSVKSSQMDLADKDFDSNLHAAAGKGWDALGEFMNKSGVDPSASGKWLPSEDGKTMQAYKTGPNGELVPTPSIFENSPKGLAEAAMFFSHQVPITAKLSHYMKVQEEARKETHELNTDKYKTKMGDVAQQNADTNERYRQDIGEAAINRSEGAGKSLFDRMDEVDKINYNNTNKLIDELSKDINKSKIDHTWDEKDPVHQGMLTNLKSLKLQASNQLSKYSKAGGGAPDPFNVNGAPQASGSTTTTRSPTSMEAVMQDMKATGTTEANLDIGGNKSTLTSGAKAEPVDSTPSWMQGMADIPEPPPETKKVGLSTAPNPLYKKWEATYGDAYRKRQAKSAAFDKAANEHSHSYSPTL